MLIARAQDARTNHRLVLGAAQVFGASLLLAAHFNQEADGVTLAVGRGKVFTNGLVEH